MRRTGLVGLVLVGTAAAAPVPPETPAQRLRRLYGEPADPAGIGRFFITPDRLTLRTTARAYGFESADRPGWRPAPRVGRPVRGDFELTVRLIGVTAPTRDAPHPGGGLRVKAGLFAAGADGTAVTVGLQVCRHLDDKTKELADYLDESVWTDSYHPGGASGTRLEEVAPGRPVWLRIARSGGRVGVLSSDDGQRWTGPWRPDKVELPDAVTVGVFLNSNTDQVCDAAFAGCTLTRPE